MAKRKIQKDKQRSIKHSHKTKDRVVNDTIMAVFFYYYTVSRFDRMWAFFSTYGQMDTIFYLVTLSWLYVLLIIILCDVLIDSGRSFLLNIRWTIYFRW